MRFTLYNYPHAINLVEAPKIMEVKKPLYLVISDLSYIYETIETFSFLGRI